MSSEDERVRRFTDRDGTLWRVEWKGGHATKIPLPRGGMHLMSNARRFRVAMSEINPHDLTEAELQEMIDAHA